MERFVDDQKGYSGSGRSSSGSRLVAALQQQLPPLMRHHDGARWKNSGGGMASEFNIKGLKMQIPTLRGHSLCRSSSMMGKT